MDTHVPGGAVRSWKDFLVHLGIVTLGILIALGLEQLVEAHRRAKVAAESVEGFRRELSDDVSQVKEVIDSAPRNRQRIADAIAQLETAAGRGPAPIVYPGITMMPLSSASWDSAIATRAVNELPYEAVRRYAAAFGAVRLFSDEERAGVAIWQNLKRFGQDSAALTQDQHVRLIEELRSYDSFLQTLDNTGQNTLKYCDAALK